MKSNLEKIVHSFIRFDYSRRTTGLFYRWLVSPESAAEKDDVLRGVWRKTKRRADKKTDESFRQVLGKIGIESAPLMVIRRVPLWQYVAAAAAVVCLSVAGTLWVSETYGGRDNAVMTECYAQNGHTEKLALPDGSTVHLNSGSFLFYPDDMKGSTRTVYLVGEGNFKVAKNPEKPFIVRSANMMITALGTEFNVKAYPEEDDVTTTLIEGKVRVNYSDTISHVLIPGQQSIYNKYTKETRMLMADMESVTAWQRGEIVFNKASISEILQTLERHYGIAFCSPKNQPSHDLYNFMFKKNVGIQEVLSVMKIVIGDFDYQLEDDICYIYWK